MIEAILSQMQTMPVKPALRFLTCLNKSKECRIPMQAYYLGIVS